MITNTLRFQVKRRHVSHDLIDGEIILIHLLTGSYYSIQKVGALIWSDLANGASIGNIIDCLKNIFVQNEYPIEDAVRSFIDHLVREELLEENPDAQPDPTASLLTAGWDPKEAFDPPVLQVYTDMQTLLLLDPIHEVDEAGWPSAAAPDLPPVNSKPNPDVPEH